MNSFINFNWNKSLYLVLYSCFNVSLARNIRHIFLQSAKVLFFCPYPSRDIIRKNVYINTNKRIKSSLDYLSISNLLSPDFQCFFVRPYTKILFYFPKLCHIIYSNRVIKSLAEYNLVKNCSFLVYCRLILTILEGIKLHYYINRNFSSIKNIFSFSEMNFYENILLQSLPNACSFSFQHALYKDCGNRFSQHNVNALQYLSSACKYTLVWGENTFNIFNRYSSTKCILVGKPYLVNKHYSRGNSKSEKKIVVLLDSKVMADFNLKVLLNFSDIYGNDSLYYVQHPNDSADFSPFGKKVGHDFISKNDCILYGNNSTVIIEYGILGYDLNIFVESDFIRKLNLSGGVTVSYVKFLKYISFPYLVNKDLWETFVKYTGKQSLSKIKDSVFSHMS